MRTIISAFHNEKAQSFRSMDVCAWRLKAIGVGEGASAWKERPVDAPRVHFSQFSFIEIMIDGIKNILNQDKS